MLWEILLYMPIREEQKLAIMSELSFVTEQ